MQMLSLHLRGDLPLRFYEAGSEPVHMRLQGRCGLHLRNSRQMKSEIVGRSPSS